MAGFLTSTDISTLTGQLITHFNTFAPHNTIIVYKEPLKTINLTQPFDTPGYPNYDNQDLSSSEATYTPVSGIYNGLVINKKNNKFDSLPATHSVIFDGDLIIKVNEEAKNYIMNGKTEKILVNGLTHTLNSNNWTQNYLGLTYYYFSLKVSN